MEQLCHSCADGSPRGAPKVRALSAALGVATRNLARVGVVVPDKDQFEHLRLYLRARFEV